MSTTRDNSRSSFTPCPVHGRPRALHSRPRAPGQARHCPGGAAEQRGAAGHTAGPQLTEGSCHGAVPHHTPVPCRGPRSCRSCCPSGPAPCPRVGRCPPGSGTVPSAPRCPPGSGTVPLAPRFPLKSGTVPLARPTCARTDRSVPEPPSRKQRPLAEFRARRSAIAGAHAVPQREDGGGSAQPEPATGTGIRRL